MWTRRFLTCGTLAREPEPPHASPRAHPLACPRWALSGLGNVLRGQRAQKTFTTFGIPSEGYQTLETVRCTNLLRKHPRVFAPLATLMSPTSAPDGGRGWTISFLKLEFADFHVYHDVSHLHR